MNDPQLGIAKLKELLQEAPLAQSSHDRAALYAAARWLLHDLQTANDQNGFHLGEHIGRARWAFGAILGFDITNGHPADHHFRWGLQALKVLKQEFPVA